MRIRGGSMAEVVEAKVPDIGDYTNVPVIEILVKPGDTVTKDQGLVTLESDKATMEVPSSVAGVVKEIKVKLGEEISEGHVVALIESADAAAPAPAAAKAAPAAAAKVEAPAPVPAAAPSGGGMQEAKVPDIGDYTNVPVIEVLVKVGDTVAKDQGLVTLESDKATMEVPSSVAGVVKELKVKVGDEVSEGHVVALIEAAGAPSAPAPAPAKAAAPAPTQSAPAPAAAAPVVAAGSPSSPPIHFGADTVMPDKVPYASPAVRAFARELGVDLARVRGSERKGRISKEDVQKFVKDVLSGTTSAPAAAGAASGGGLNLLPWPKVDFAKFGEVETKPLSRIQKISGANLARNWAM